MIKLILTAFIVFLIVVGIYFFIKKPVIVLIDKYKPEHIADFVAFAKTQLHLPRVKAIKAICQEFRHLELLEAVEVYELAIKDNTDNLNNINKGAVLE